MKKSSLIRVLPVMIFVIALALTVPGCKKKMPKETPPPPKVEEVTPQSSSDTTGSAERAMQEEIERDRSRLAAQAVYFDYDRSDIRADQRDKIKTQAEILRKWENWSANIEGHSDERGTSEYNIALGERRAKAVERALAAEGIAASRLSTVSYGKERPADMGHNESAWAKNRRAETKTR